MTLAQIQKSIDNVETNYFYSMRTFNDAVDRDEALDRLNALKRRIIKIDTSKFKAIQARRRELNK